MGRNWVDASLQRWLLIMTPVIPTRRRNKALWCHTAALESQDFLRRTGGPAPLHSHKASPPPSLSASFELQKSRNLSVPFG